MEELNFSCYHLLLISWVFFFFPSSRIHESLFFFLRLNTFSCLCFPLLPEVMTAFIFNVVNSNCVQCTFKNWYKQTYLLFSLLPASDTFLMLPNSYFLFSLLNLYFYTLQNAFSIPCIPLLLFLFLLLFSWTVFKIQICFQLQRLKDFFFPSQNNTFIP